MPSSMSLEKELALIDIGYACFGIPKFRGQEEEFIGWLSKVERVFACCILNDQEKFKVVISRLRGCALQWWQTYKIKRRKKGKEKVRSWKKMRSKLMGAFCPPSYILKHVPLLPPPLQNEPFNKGSSNPFPKPTVPSSSTLQKAQTPLNNLPPQNRSNPIPFGKRRCLKCQGLGHTTTDCPNENVITLVEWEAMKEYGEEEKEEDIQDALEETQEEEENKEGQEEVIRKEDEETEKEVVNNLEEVEERTDLGEMLALSSNHSQTSHSHPSPFLTFCDSLPKVPSNEVRTFKEGNLDASKGASPNQIQLSLNDKWKRVSKVKRDLFEGLILFQPFTSPLPPSLLSHVFFFSFKPLTQKFCHKDKWKDPMLVI